MSWKGSFCHLDAMGPLSSKAHCPSMPSSWCGWYGSQATLQEQTQAVHHFWLYPLQHLPFPHADNIRHTPQIAQHLSFAELHVLPNLVVKTLHPNPLGLESSEKAPELASVASTNLPRVPVVRLQLRCQDALVAILVATMTGHSWWISTVLQPEMRLPSIHVVSIGWPAPCLAAQANDLSAALEPWRLAKSPILLDALFIMILFLGKEKCDLFQTPWLASLFGAYKFVPAAKHILHLPCHAVVFEPPLMAYIAPARWFTSITLLSSCRVLGCSG